jgi:hypothetical protein
MSLGNEYRELVDEQAPDWSDLRFELVLPDEARLDEARLLMAPTQFERTPGTRTLFSFRVSRVRGYGCFDDLAESCLRKLDERLIGGRLTLDRVFHSVEPNMTQGPTF